MQLKPGVPPRMPIQAGSDEPDPSPVRPEYNEPVAYTDRTGPSAYRDPADALEADPYGGEDPGYGAYGGEDPGYDPYGHIEPVPMWEPTQKSGGVKLGLWILGGIIALFILTAAFAPEERTDASLIDGGLPPGGDVGLDPGAADEDPLDEDAVLVTPGSETETDPDEGNATTPTPTPTPTNETDPAPTPSPTPSPSPSPSPTNSPGPAPVPPQASFSSSCTDLSCSFDSGSSPGSAPITQHSWSFGDGSSGSGVQVTHTYAGGGTYTVTLTVTDANGLQSTTSRQVDAVAPPPGPKQFSGNGDHTTALFSTEQRLLKVSVTNGGTSNLSVWLHREGGTVEALVVEGSGGSRYLNPPPGSYYFSVVADGAWEITVTQPVLDGGASPPVEWSGSGNTASGVLALSSGSLTFNLTHGGAGDFVVTLYDASGLTVSVLVDTDGAHSGNVTVEIPASGSYVLDIMAGGAWTVKIG